MKKEAKKIAALFLTAGILLSGTAACSNVEGMHLSGSTRKLNVTKEDTGKSGDNVQMLPSDEKSDKIFADSYADFAIKAFQNSYEAGKNTMISPYSVINALAMTANGASGETLEQMENVLCGTADCSLDLLNRELQRLQSSMPKGKNNHLYTANSIWYKDSDENFVPADDFLKLNAEFYQADIFASAFTGALLSSFPLPDCARIAADFTLESIERTLDDPEHWYGVKFELALPRLMRLLGRI